MFKEEEFRYIDGTTEEKNYENFINSFDRDDEVYYRGKHYIKFMKEQLKRKEQEYEFWKKELDKTHPLMLKRQDDLVKEILKNDQLKAENEGLKTEFDKFEEQIKLQENFIDGFLFATKNSEWRNKSILEDEADAIIEKVESDYVQLDNYKQALQEIKKIAEDDCKTCIVKLLGEDEINCKRCYKTKILQKCEVLKNE